MLPVEWFELFSFPCFCSVSKVLKIAWRKFAIKSCLHKMTMVSECQCPIMVAACIPCITYSIQFYFILFNIRHDKWITGWMFLAWDTNKYKFFFSIFFVSFVWSKLFGAEFGIKLHSGWDKYCLSCLPGVQSAQSGWPPIPVSPAAAASPVTEANAPPAYSQLQQVAGWPIWRLSDTYSAYPDITWDLLLYLPTYSCLHPPYSWFQCNNVRGTYW